MKSTFFNALRSVAYIVTFGILAIATTGCSSSEKGKDKSLSVSEKSVILDAEGGSQKVLISAEGLNWIASSSDSWVKVTPESGTGDSYLMISADANPSADIRTAVVTIEAPGVKGVSITVLQNEGSGSDVSTFDAQAVMLSYFGDYFNTGSKTCAVVMNILSKDLNSDYSIDYPYSSIQLVLNVPYSSDYTTAVASVFGHSFSGSSTYGEYTIDLQTSAFGTAKGSSSSDITSVAVTSATVTVSSMTSSGSATVSFDVKLSDGTSLSGTYSGTSIYYGDSTGSDDTTLTDDVTPAIASASATIYYNLSVDNEIIKDFSLCYLTLESRASNNTKERIAIALYMEYSAASNKELSAGTYKVAPDEAESWSDFLYTFDKGDIDDNYFYPTFYAQMVSENGGWAVGETYALVTDGTVVISKSDNAYDLDINLKDSQGHKITYKGTISVQISARNGSSSTSSVQSATARKITHNDFRIKPSVNFTKIR